MSIIRCYLCSKPTDFEETVEVELADNSTVDYCEDCYNKDRDPPDPDDKLKFTAYWGR